VSTTERIYYLDAYAREFVADVLEMPTHEGRPAAILNRTALYPTSGGQPFDTGTLGDARVLDVIDRDDGVVVHVLDRPVARGPVHGTVDWVRRFDHMQQHTGQHVLSAAFEKLLNARTTSFHLGSERSTIDLSRDLSAAEIARAEMDANRVVWENRPVLVRFVSDEEAASLPLRKEPTRTGKIRIVEVEGYDLSACGGTHVARTGAIGMIGVGGSEKYKGGVRIEFVCGTRALRAYAAARETIAGCVRQLSVLPSELPDALGRLQSDLRDLQKANKGLQGKLAGFEAQALVGLAAPVGPWRVIAETSEWDAGGLKMLAMSAAATPGVIAVLFNPAGGLIAVARAADVRFDAAAAITSLVGEFGGRGGGRPELAQAGGLSGAAVLERARELIARAAASAPTA
jgi:alanyl-tRNA synthetase